MTCWRRDSCCIHLPLLLTVCVRLCMCVRVLVSVCVCVLKLLKPFGDVCLKIITSIMIPGLQGISEFLSILFF